MKNERTIFVVDDDAGFRKVWRALLEGEGFRVIDAKTAPEAAVTFTKERPALVILDLMLPPSGLPREGAELLEGFVSQRPDTKVIVVSGTPEKSLALDLVRRGAYDFVEKPVDPDVLLAIIARAAARLDLEARVHELEASLGEKTDGPMGSAPTFVAARELAKRAAPTDIPVLITGPSGSGKEVFARYVHAESRRAARSFVAVNCGALAPTLLESTLFGHKKGAFTGATDTRPGLFVEADKGTLFLDEIGDLDTALQVKLLRALETGEILPVGSEKTVSVDVRLVSATHKPLEQMLSAATFRDDLYYRIRGIEVALPSLAERPEDLPMLANHFLRQARAIVPGSASPTLSGEALRRLESHDWPGNLRELRHEMQRALVMTGGRSEILEDDLSPSLRRPKPAVAAPAASNATLEQKIEALERVELSRALGECQGNKSRAAELLGLSRQGFLNKLARHGMK